MAMGSEGRWERPFHKGKKMNLSRIRSSIFLVEMILAMPSDNYDENKGVN